MKTFKLLSISFQDAPELVNLPLLDGITIIHENDPNTWLIELYTKAAHLPFFETAKAKGRKFRAQATITHNNHDPIAIVLQVFFCKKIEDNATIILKGKTNRPTPKTYAETLLAKLVATGLSGEPLLKEFKSQLTPNHQNHEAN